MYLNLSLNRVTSKGNETFRSEWVAEKLSQISSQSGNLSLLDVGAGMSPFKELIMSLGYSYKSQDFSGYVPNSKVPGIQDKKWEYPIHNFICDITEIPNNLRFDVILCTEVLEHVPDPVRAFQHLATLLTPNGRLVMTVPFLSLMHQAPYWFQSGLSPFWFEYWSKRSKLEVIELTINGDYIDLLSQEIKRLFSFSHRTRQLGIMLGSMTQKLRKRTAQSTLDSGAFGTFFLAKPQAE